MYECTELCLRVGPCGLVHAQAVLYSMIRKRHCVHAFHPPLSLSAFPKFNYIHLGNIHIASGAIFIEGAVRGFVQNASVRVNF